MMKTKRNKTIDRYVIIKKNGQQIIHDSKNNTDLDFDSVCQRMNYLELELECARINTALNLLKHFGVR